MIPKVLLPPALLLGLAACAPPADIAPAAEGPGGSAATPAGVETITPADIYARVAFLASDALRGRDTPSQGLEAAAAYLTSEYLRMGLRPAGENGTFLQRYPFPLRRLRAEGTSLAFTGAGGAALVYGRDFYAAGATPEALRGALVFTGAAVPDARPAAESLRDRIAVMPLPGSPRERDWRILRRSQAAQAEREGARGVIHVLAPGVSAQEIAMLAERAAAPVRALGTAAGFPEWFLSYQAAQRVLGAGGVSLDALWAEATAPGSAVEPVMLSGVTATGAIALEELDRATAPNVVAVLPGSDPTLRDEYVVLSAHLDHVGVGEPDARGDSIYNGADDDASGNAALLEVAEALASLPERPARSVVFLHVSGEEKGLLGSRWYSDHPTVPLERIVANVNVDMIGRNSPDSVVVIGKDYSSLGQVVDAVGARHPELGLVVSDDLWPEERFFFRSDHFNFARKEVPAIFFFTGVHEDYHRPSDEVQLLDVDKTARVARLIYHTVRAVADTGPRPVWDPAGLAEVRALTR